jgi:hypothetical protein
MKVICIDDDNKPKNVPIEEWILEGDIYTVTKIVKMGLQKDIYGFLLKEIQLSSKSFPYELYDSSRFLPIGILSDMKEEKEVNMEDVNLELI